jgi:hypothetical protein
MINFRSFLTAENMLLFAFILVSQATDTMFSFTRTEPPPGFDTLISFGQLYALGYWLHADSLRRPNFNWPYCRGVFVYAAGIIVVPYYLFKTRGARAFLTLLIFVSMVVVATLAGALAATLLIAPAFD